MEEVRSVYCQWLKPIHTPSTKLPPPTKIGFLVGGTKVFPAEISPQQGVGRSRRDLPWSCIFEENTVQKKPLLLYVFRPGRWNVAELCDLYSFRNCFIPHPVLGEFLCAVLCRARENCLGEDNFCLGWIRFWVVGGVLFWSCRLCSLIVLHFRFWMNIFSTHVFLFPRLKTQYHPLEITFSVFISLYCEGEISQVAFFYY